MTTFASSIVLAEIAASIGDVSRANILSALMDGRALTASELAWHSGVSPQTASGHLAKLVETSLLAVERQGRHRYYRLATPEVAHALEALMALAATGPKRYRPVGPKDAALRNARTCYDHFAGRLGTALADSLIAQDNLILADGAGIVTDRGKTFLQAFGVQTGEDSKSRRPVCRTCLDWSERRPHLGGRLGAALCIRCFDLGWVERIKDSRALSVTSSGRTGLTEAFGIAFDAEGMVSARESA